MAKIMGMIGVRVRAVLVGLLLLVGQAACWEGPEHQAIGNKAWEKVLKDCPNLSKTGLSLNGFKLKNGVTVSFGDLVGLAGDIFGPPDTTISFHPRDKARELFAGVVKELAEGSEAPRVIRDVLKVFANTLHYMQLSLAQGMSPLVAFVDHGHEFERDLSRVTATGVFAALAPRNIKGADWSPTDWFNILVQENRLTNLAPFNADHFGPPHGAEDAYGAGEELAVELAKNASKLSTKKDKLAMLQNALVHLGVANHFLSDMFSAGHVFTPRVELVHDCRDNFRQTNFGKSVVGKLLEKLPLAKTTTLGLGGLLSKCMHDEDNMLSVNVSSKHRYNPGAKPEEIYWSACGDGMLFDPKCEENFKEAVAASASSIIKVLAHFDDKLCPTSAGTTYMRPWDRVPVYAGDNNHNSMFTIRNSEVKVRYPLDDLKSSKYESIDDCLDVALRCYKYVGELGEKQVPPMPQPKKSAAATCYYQYDSEKRTGPFYIKQHGECHRKEVLKACSTDGNCEKDDKNPCKGTCVCADECRCAERVDPKEVLNKCKERKELHFWN